jgi:hypothetical protein
VNIWGLVGQDDTQIPENTTLYVNGRKATNVAAGFRHSLILFDDGACLLHVTCS